MSMSPAAPEFRCGVARLLPRYWGGERTRSHPAKLLQSNGDMLLLLDERRTI
jgi:hypothetical protein